MVAERARYERFLYTAAADPLELFDPCKAELSASYTGDRWRRDRGHRYTRASEYLWNTFSEYRADAVGKISFLYYTSFSYNWTPEDEYVSSDTSRGARYLDEPRAFVSDSAVRREARTLLHKPFDGWADRVSSEPSCTGHYMAFPSSPKGDGDSCLAPSE